MASAYSQDDSSSNPQSAIRNPQSVDSLSLSQAIDIALKNNKAVNVAELGVQQTESHLKETKSTRYPSFYFRSHYMVTPQNGYNEVITNGGEYGVQVTAGLPLYDGGVREATINQASNAIDRSNLNLSKSKIDIAFTIRTLYFDILHAEEELHIRRETVERLRDYLDLLTRMQKGGGASQSDVLKAQVDLNSALTDVEVSSQDLNRLKQTLANELGTALDRAVEIAPLNPADSSALPEFSVDNNPDVQMLQRDKAESEFDVTLSQAERLPSLSVSGDFGALGVYPDQFSHNIGYSLLLTLDIPIFTWGGIDNRVEQKQIAVQQFDAQLELQRREYETQWRVALSDLATVKKNLTSLASNIGVANDNYVSAKARFAGGSGSNLDVLDSQRLLVEAKLSYNDALFQLRSDFATLLRLAGKQ